MNNKPPTETILYVEFYLAGDCIFKCQKSWLPEHNDIKWKCLDLADIHNVENHLITYAEVVVEIPITLPFGYMNNLLKGMGIDYRGENL